MSKSVVNGRAILRMVGLAGAAAALAAAALASAQLRVSSARTVELEARRRTEVSRSALREALAAALRELEVQAVAAAALGPIRNLVNDPDRRTIEDGLAHEAWWQPQRTRFASSGVVFGDPSLDAYAGALAAAAPTTLLEKARASRVASAVADLKGTPALVAAAMVEIPSRTGAPAVVFLAETLDGATLGSLASRARAPLALSDGRRLSASSGDDAAPLRLLAGREGEGVVVDSSRRWAAAADRVGDGVWLWSLASSEDVAAQEARAVANGQILFWSIAAALAALILWATNRRWTAAPQRSESDALLRETAQKLEETRQQLARLTPPAANGDLAGVEATQRRMDAAVPIALTSEAPSSDGATFGRYHLVDKIGTGGMGEIYTAVAYGAAGFKRQFVVKRLRAELSREPELVRQFIEEARLGARLVHSNIVPVFDFGRVGEDYYLAQEYLNGRDLDRLVLRSMERDGAPLPPPVVIHVAHAVLQALSYAHRLADESGAPLGLVHRDISPNNVLVSARGEVKLLDFGIVKATTRASETKSGVVKGNVNCMAPEQARGQAVDARSDLFALGLTLYRCLSGQWLYGHGNSYDLLIRAAGGPNADDLQKVRALPGGIGAILERVLQPDAALRFSSAEELAAALPPAPATAVELTASLVVRLWGEELAAEISRFSAPNATEVRAR